MKKIFWILFFGMVLTVFAVLISKKFFGSSKLLTDKLLNAKDIQKEQEFIEQLNHSLPKKVLMQWPKQVLGKDERNGFDIVRFGRCSDICPDQAGIIMLYDGDISQEECLDINGNAVWETIPGYIGCRPKIETSTEVFVSAAQATQMVRSLPEVREFLTRVDPYGHVIIDHEEMKENTYVIHVYENPLEHTVTFNWYEVNKATGEIRAQF